jgi:Bacterial Ig-like domain (group 2)
VQPEPAALSFADATIIVMRGRQRTLQAIVVDSNGVELNRPLLSWAVLDTSIATVDTEGVVTARREGTTTVSASTGIVSGSVALSVAPYPRLRPAVDTIVLASGTQLWDVPAIFADSSSEERIAQVSATVLDTTVAWVRPSFPIPRVADSDPRPEFEGRAVGVTRAILSAPGWSDAEIVIRVLPLELGQSRRREQWIDYPEWAFIGAQTIGGIGAYLNDALGRPVRVVSPRLVRFASSDTSVVRLMVDSAFAANSEPAIVQFEVRRAGTAEIVASSPGVLPETVVVRTRDRGFYFTRFGYELPADTVGVGYRSRVKLASRAFVPTVGAEQVVTLTQRRPDLLQLPTEPVTLRWYEPQPSMSYVGLAPGVDTLIATAPGHAADTLVVRIVPAVLPPVVTPDTLGFIQYFTLTGTTGEWAGANPIVLRVTSSDTSVLAPDTAFVTVQNTLQYSFAVLRRGVGSASFTLSDTSGLHPPRTLDPIEVRRSWLHLYMPDLPAGGARLGVRQRRNVGVETDWWAGSGFQGTLRSSDTSIVRLSASAFPRLPYAFDIESGDVPGSAWIIAQGNGFTTDSVRVTVTRGVLDLGPATTLRSGIISGFSLNVLVRDSDGNERITRDSLFLKVRSTDRSRLALRDSVVVIPAGSSASGPISYITAQLGPVGVTVTPMRPLGPNIDASSTGYVIVPAFSSVVQKVSAPP